VQTRLAIQIAQGPARPLRHPCGRGLGSRIVIPGELFARPGTQSAFLGPGSPLRFGRDDSWTAGNGGPQSPTVIPAKAGTHGRRRQPRTCNLRLAATHIRERDCCDLSWMAAFAAMTGNRTRPLNARQKCRVLTPPHNRHPGGGRHPFKPNIHSLSPALEWERVSHLLRCCCRPSPQPSRRKNEAREFRPPRFRGHDVGKHAREVGIADAALGASLRRLLFSRLPARGCSGNRDSDFASF
jgi:hypothetical protein